MDSTPVGCSLSQIMQQGPAMGHPYQPRPLGSPFPPFDQPYFDALNDRWVDPLHPMPMPKFINPEGDARKLQDILQHPSHDPRPGKVAIPAEVKPTNPKQLYGDKKPPVHLIHQIAELHESAALHSGKRKYGENNYLKTEVEAMTYVGAMLRHIKAWVSGERVDPKELVHHLGAVKACATILLVTEATGMLIDNRPTAGCESREENFAPARYQTATAAALKEVEATIEHLNKLYPELL
jgi:hypothetical protein